MKQDNLQKIHTELMNVLGMSDNDYFLVASKITPEILLRYLNYTAAVYYELGYYEQIKKFPRGIERPINVYDKNGNLVNNYDSRGQASRLTGYPGTSIFKAIKFGIIYKDFFWKYAEK
jgi:hypothetical protein